MRGKIMGRAYELLISEGSKLLNTFTINYEVENYEDEFFSSTYDELSGWVRKVLKEIEKNEDSGKDSDLYKYVRKFRGRAGDISLKEMNRIMNQLLRD
jgi:hypothetical protein